MLLSISNSKPASVFDVKVLFEFEGATPFTSALATFLPPRPRITYLWLRRMDGPKVNSLNLLNSFFT